MQCQLRPVRGLRLDDEAVRVAVGLRLGSNLCVPHQCQCGSFVTAHGLHGFICKKAPIRKSRHHALNDLVALLSRLCVGCNTWPKNLTVSPGQTANDPMG